ncbi:MAG TPA: hypothetical protein VE844_21575, partial [Gammaproteobacteria bacterium]|nr:hypothetical protein [Gammaproteobacteria bacterium]
KPRQSLIGLCLCLHRKPFNIHHRFPRTLLTRLSQLTTRFSEFSRFDGCKRLIFLHAHPEKGL